VLKRFAGKALPAGLVVGLAGSWPAAGAGSPVHEPGVGSSLAARKTAYGSGSHCNPRLCFGPFIENTADGRVHEFVAVQATGSRRVNSYDRAFPTKTSSFEALLMILATLPPKAKATGITIARTKTGSDTCGEFNVTSATVGQELARTIRPARSARNFGMGPRGTAPATCRTHWSPIQRTRRAPVEGTWR
jgi:hypothetical protein